MIPKLATVGIDLKFAHIYARKGVEIPSEQEPNEIYERYKALKARSKTEEWNSYLWKPTQVKAVRAGFYNYSLHNPLITKPMFFLFIIIFVLEIYVS